MLAIVGLLTIILAAIGLPKTEFATGQESYLNSDSQVSIDNEKYQQLFGGETMIMLFTAEDGKNFTDFFTDDNIAKFEQIKSELDQNPNIEAVVTPLEALKLTAEIINSNTAQNALLGAATRDTDGALARQGDLGISAARLLDPSERTLDNPTWRDALMFDNTNYGADGSPPAVDQKRVRTSLQGFFPDLEHSVGGIVFKGNATLDELGDATDATSAVMDGLTFENLEVMTTGSPAFLKDINDYLQGGMLTLGAIAIAVMAVVLWLVFRVRWRLLALLTVLIGIVIAFSLLAIGGMSLSLVTISGLPILIGMGIDFAIQVHNRVEEEVVLDSEEHPMSETLQGLAPPLIIATIAAIIAFLALRASAVPMIRDFGVLLAVGIAVMVVIGIVVPTALLGIREWRSPTTERQDSPAIENAVTKLGSLPQSVVPLLILASVGLFVAGVLLEDRFEIESDPIRWVDQDSEAVKNIERLGDEVDVASTLGILLEAPDVTTDEIGSLVWDFVNEDLLPDERISSVSSLYTTTGWVHDLPTVEGTASVPPVQTDILGVMTAAETVVPDIRRILISDDQQSAQLNLRLGPSSLEERAVLVDELTESLEERIEASGIEGLRATPSGLAVVGVGLLENLRSNRAVLTYLALGLVALWLLVRYTAFPRWAPTRSLMTSPAKALLSLVPVLLALGVSSLVIALSGLKLSPLTTVSGPLVIATCAEFSVLILARFLEEREKGLSAQEASDHASARTGRAFVTSALTTIGGFGVLIFSSLPLLRDFGIIVTLNVAVALLSALVVLPPLLIWADRKGFLGT